MLVLDYLDDIVAGLVLQTWGEQLELRCLSCLSVYLFLCSSGRCAVRLCVGFESLRLDEFSDSYFFHGGLLSPQACFVSVFFPFFPSSLRAVTKGVQGQYGMYFANLHCSHMYPEFETSIRKSVTISVSQSYLHQHPDIHGIKIGKSIFIQDCGSSWYL